VSCTAARSNQIIINNNNHHHNNDNNNNNNIDVTTTTTTSIPTVIVPTTPSVVVAIPITAAISLVSSNDESLTLTDDQLAAEIAALRHENDKLSTAIHQSM
jgi:hypothetical protein